MSSTPILDLEQAPPRLRSRGPLMLVALLIGMGFGAIPMVAEKLLPNWRWPTPDGLLIFPALYFAVVIHELGHAIGGILVGFKTGAIDGARLITLARKAESAQQWVVLMHLQTQNAEGVRPREWDRVLFEQV